MSPQGRVSRAVAAMLVAWAAATVGAGVTRAAVACPVTIPNGSPFPPGGGSFTSAPGMSSPPPTHGNGVLWVGYLAPDGVIRVRDEYVQADGSIELKFPWARKVIDVVTVDGAGLGVFAGELEIDVERLDAAAADVSIYTNPQGVHVGSILTFPSTGCWRVTGRTGPESLTFTFALTLESQPAPDTALDRPSPLVRAGLLVLMAGVGLALMRVTHRQQTA